MIELIRTTSIKIELTDNDWKQILSKEKISKAIQDENVEAFDICFNQEIIGFVMIYLYEDGVFLWNYAIDSNKQNQGLGMSALAYIIDYYKKRNFKFMTTTYLWGNDNARKCYESVGFKESDIVNEDGIHEVNMKIEFK